MTTNGREALAAYVAGSEGAAGLYPFFYGDVNFGC
jgi:hypothetical protein